MKILIISLSCITYIAASASCPRGNYYKKECNDCTCDELTGLIQCTSNDCDAFNFKSTNYGSNYGGPSAACPRGTKYKKDCNDCTCDPLTGLTQCSSNNCNLNSNHHRNTNRYGGVSAACPRGTNFKKDCNDCTCDPLTGLTQCSSNDCDSLNEDLGLSNIFGEPTAACPRGANYKKDCNDCFCDQVTGLTQCSSNDCDSIFRKRVRVKNVGGSSAACPRGTNYKKDCNDCTCDPLTGLSQCSSNDCNSLNSNRGVSNNFDGPSAACPRGSKYKKDCNDCTCDQLTGLIQCSHNDCYAKPNKILQYNKCPRGLHFKEDCNDCTCNPQTGYVQCTINDCLPSYRNINPTANQKCSRGLEYMDDCNKCTCNQITGQTTCTLKDCSVPSQEFRDLQEQEENKNYSPFRMVCSPGIIFPGKDCNKCTCSNDGTTYTCTNFDCSLNEPKLNPEDARRPTKFCPNGIQYKDNCSNSCSCNPINGRTNCPVCTPDNPKYNPNNNNNDNPAIDIRQTEKYNIEPEPRCTPNTFYPSGMFWCLCDSQALSINCSLRSPPGEMSTHTDSLVKPFFEQKSVQTPLPMINTVPPYVSQRNNGFGSQNYNYNSRQNIQQSYNYQLDRAAYPYNPNPVCKPYSSFWLDCNICTCSSNGYNYGCTQYQCPSNYNYHYNQYRIFNI